MRVLFVYFVQILLGSFQILLENSIVRNVPGGLHEPILFILLTDKLLFYFPKQSGLVIQFGTEISYGYFLLWINSDHLFDTFFYNLFDLGLWLCLFQFLRDYYVEKVVLDFFIMSDQKSIEIFFLIFEGKINLVCNNLFLLSPQPRYLLFKLCNFYICSLSICYCCGRWG